MGQLFLSDLGYDERGNLKFTHSQQVGNILNENEEFRINSEDDWKKKGHMKRVGRVPHSVWLLWESLGITNDDQELLKALERNPEYKVTERQLA